jgi:hypothetical protein
MVTTLHNEQTRTCNNAVRLLMFLSRGFWTDEASQQTFALIIIHKEQNSTQSPILLKKHYMYLKNMQFQSKDENYTKYFRSDDDNWWIAVSSVWWTSFNVCGPKGFIFKTVIKKLKLAFNRWTLPRLVETSVLSRGVPFTVCCVRH